MFLLPSQNKETKKQNCFRVFVFSYFHEKGFTLLEIIFSIGIGLVLFLATIYVYDLSQNVYFRADNKAEITQNGRVILDRISRELRQTPDVVTEIPETNDDPEVLPDEIIFQDGHNTSEIKYIRYYLDNEQIKKQTIVYYFDIEPNTYVYWYATDQQGNPPTMSIQENIVIGEYVNDMEFWGNSIININLYLEKNNQSQIIYTAIYGRNL